MKHRYTEDHHEDFQGDTISKALGAGASRELFDDTPARGFSGSSGRIFMKFLLLLAMQVLFLVPYVSKGQVIQPNSPVVETSGDIILFALPATALGATLIQKDYGGTWEFTKGFLLNQAVTLGLKYAINKDRPFKSGHYAFPSGHTSITFQAASFIHLRYGLQYGIPAYLAAGWTAYSRINATRHDGWDVLAGIVAGVGSSALFTTPWKEDVRIIFHSDPNEWSIGFTYKF